MELIWWGNTVQDNQWQVEEVTSCGFLRIYYVISGNLTYTDALGMQKLQAGKGYIFPSHVPYRLVHDPAIPFCCVWLHVNALPYKLQKLICITDMENPIFTQIFTLLRALTEQPAPDEQSIASCAQLLVEQLCRQSYLVRIDHAFYQIVEQLRESALQSLQINDFARMHGYTSEHFIRLFQKEMQQSPYQFVINCKMTRARELLRMGVSINEICDAIGYADVKNFDKAFKKKHGMTASAYRNNALRRA